MSTDIPLQISNWRVPSISAKDRVLHSVFLTSILIMIICSVATILSFKQADTLPKVCSCSVLVTVAGIKSSVRTT